MRGFLLLGVVATIAAAHRHIVPTTARTAHAAPSVIVFRGGLLQKPIVLSNWPENLRLMLGLSDPILVSGDALASRPHVDVAMYWGAAWNRFALPDDLPVLLSRVREAQRGTYYPRFRGAPAVWAFDGVDRVFPSRRIVTADAEAILRRHGVPLDAK